jgi:uncharacterized SAM-binding protein YcdF (DUF218 family)
MRLVGIVRPLLVLLLALALGFVPAPQGAQAQAAELSLNQLRTRAIYYQQDGNQTQLALVLGTIAERSSWEGKVWNQLLDAWDGIDASLEINGTVPDDLPTSGHVFVVLGAGLVKKTGAISAAMARRLKVTLKALKAYPDSLVLATGGVERGGRTEGQAMRQWLREQGVADDRILIETASASTVSNASNSMAILRDHPEITSYSLISDASHLRRASILFHAARARIQIRTGTAWAISQQANVAYLDTNDAGKRVTAAAAEWNASNVASLFEVKEPFLALLDSPPAAAKLTSIRASTRRASFAAGARLASGDLVVSAVYAKGRYTRVVTARADVEGFTSGKVGRRTATVSYTERGVTRTDSVEYAVVKAGSTVDATLSSTKARRNRTRVTVKVDVATATGIAPTGTVRYFVDGARVGSDTLTAADAGRAKLKRPTLGALGKHAVVVKYLGNARLKADRQSVVLTVKR